MISITLNDGKFQADFVSLVARSKRPRSVMMAVGRQAHQELRRHFLQKDRSEPNRLGGRRTHYWLGVRSSVQTPVIQEGDNSVQARVSITEPTFAQKVFGGVIRAKNVRMLTIPQTPEAHGRTAETFEAETGLKLFVVGKKGSRFAALAAKFASGAVVVEYVLKPAVNQQPTPGALPDMSDGGPFKRALLDRAQAAVEREIVQGNQS